MKKRVGKLAALLLAVLMMSTAVAGCGTSSSSSGGGPQSAAAAGGGNGLKPVTLHFYMFDGKKADTDKVWSAISEKYKDKLNATFDVQFIAGTDYKQKMLVKAASGDKWDLNFDGDWPQVMYYQMIAKDAYMNLDDLLPKYAPDLYKAYQGSGALEAAKSKGHIVALPWTMTQSTRPFFQWRGDLAKQAGLNIDPASVKTVEDVDALVQKLKSAFPDRKILEVADIATWELKYSQSALSHNYVFDLTDGKCTAIPLEQTPAFKEMAEQAQKWQNDGIIWKDVLTDKTDHNQMIDQGLLITKWGTHEYANQNRAWSEKGAYWASNPLYNDSKYANRSPLANVVAIPRTSENPERTLMFLNMLQTDKDLYDMVMYGIKGETYNLDGDAAVYPSGMTTANSNYMDWGGRWAFWKPEFMRPDSTYGKGFWIKEADYVKSNTNNVVSPLEGFNFDVDSINNEVSQRDQIFDDANKLIQVGLAGDPDKAVDDLIQKEKDAGVDKVTAELQKQIDAFLTAKK
jgi:ABC-type sugar transport system, periplasmic component